MTTETEIQTDESQLPRLVSPKQLSEMIGVTTSCLSQWRYAKQGPPSFRLGGFVRYDVQEVVAWIEEQRQKSKEVV